MITARVPTALIKRFATLSKHGPAICTAAGIGLMVTAIGLAIDETPDALDILSNEGIDTFADAKADPKAAIGAVVRAYWPMALSATCGITLLILAQASNQKRISALLASYALSEQQLKDFKAAVAEKLKPHEIKACEAKAAQKNIDRDNPDESQIIQTSGGQDLFKDGPSGRYFYSSYDAVIHAETMANRILSNDTWISQSEIYDCLELSPTTVSDLLGFDAQNGPLEFQITPCQSWKNTPCFLVDYRLKPMYSNRF